jgi:selenobiotic family peptide radical SAM maturase
MHTSENKKSLQHLLDQTGIQGHPKLLSELARLKQIVKTISCNKLEIPQDVSQIIINPTVQLINFAWKNLTFLLNSGEQITHPAPERQDEFVLVWKDPNNGTTKIKPASNEDLLVLKIVDAQITPEKTAQEGNLSVGLIDAAIYRAVIQGILLAPKSRIRRDPAIFLESESIDESFLSSDSFTLQWHITQACDLHCKHCYDRSMRSNIEFNQAIKILDDFRVFCKSRLVKGAVSFTGGNPLLYPHFLELYRAASERGFSIAILGNPSPPKQIKELLGIQRPTHFQVSLEGLPEHNDSIRGAGHFSRVAEFLKLLREFNIYSMVMLTLTRDNMEQVLPLSEMLCGLTDRFHFNRLSMVGEGANLHLPDKGKYIEFLESYVSAAEKNPILGMKDNLINILYHKKGMKPFGGCTGYGCGAAFNFLTLLPDGEVHACRKFPSLIGNISHQNIAEIYESDIAKRYRSGCNICRSCAIRPVCGGCLAIAHSHHLNIFEEKDPYCFMNTHEGSYNGYFSVRG